MSKKIIQPNKGAIKDELKELARSSGASNAVAVAPTGNAPSRAIKTHVE